MKAKNQVYEKENVLALSRKENSIALTLSSNYSASSMVEVSSKEYGRNPQFPIHRLWLIAQRNWAESTELFT
jgi:hypothetical protein